MSRFPIFTGKTALLRACRLGMEQNGGGGMEIDKVNCIFNDYLGTKFRKEING